MTLSSESVFLNLRFLTEKQKQTGVMLSQGPFQLQHFTMTQLLISALMSFLYRENATDTPHVGRVLRVVFLAVLADGQCSTLAPALSPLFLSRSPTRRPAHGLCCPLESLGEAGRLPSMVTTGLAGEGGWVSIPLSGTNLLGGCRQDLASLRLIHLMESSTRPGKALGDASVEEARGA